MPEIINEDDINDIAVIVIDELVKAKIITNEQGGFTTQDIICDSVKKVLNRKSLNENIENNSISAGELE